MLCILCKCNMSARIAIRGVFWVAPVEILGLIDIKWKNSWLTKENTSLDETNFFFCFQKYSHDDVTPLITVIVW